MVLHLQDHFPLNHVPKAAPLGCAILSFCFRRHCMDGSRPSFLGKDLSQDPHNFLLHFPPRGSLQDLPGSCLEALPASPWGWFLSFLCRQSLLYLHICFWLFFFVVFFCVFLNAGIAICVSGILGFFFWFSLFWQQPPPFSENGASLRLSCRSGRQRGKKGR